MSSVFSIELEGISNACTTKVMMNKPVTSTAASEARNSTVVSFGFSSFGVSESGFSLPPFTSTLLSLFATITFPYFLKISVYQPQRAIPARDLEEVRHGIRHMLQPAGRRIRVNGLHRPVNQQRPPDDIFARHEAPVTAVLAVIPVVPHHEI